MGARNPDTLSARWSKREQDIVFNYPRKCDGSFLFGMLCHDWRGEPSMVEELKRRGYDIETLRFSVRRCAKEVARG